MLQMMHSMSSAEVLNEEFGEPWPSVCYCLESSQAKTTVITEKVTQKRKPEH